MISNQVHIHTKYINETVEIRYKQYASNGNPVIEGYDLAGFPVFCATVNVPEFTPNEGCCFLKGWSENEGLPDALVKVGIVELTGRVVPCGYCSAKEARILSNSGSEAL